MDNKNFIQFIDKAGGCIISRNILEGKGQLRWAFREVSVNDTVDNGWRFLSGCDDDEFLSKPQNMVVCDFNTMANIEPAVLGIYLYPVGSDLQFVIEDGQRVFYDNKTGKKVELIYSTKS